MYLQNTARDKGLADANRAIGTRLDQPVSIDLLTGVFSRHFLCELATARFSEARRHGYYASVVVLEVDRFAELLGNEGQRAADEVLVNVAELLRACIRREDMVARFDAARFVVLMMHCDSENAMAKAEALRCAISDLEPAGIPVTASAGVASASVRGTVDLDALLEPATRALAEAQTHTGNAVVLGRIAPPSQTAVPAVS